MAKVTDIGSPGKSPAKSKSKTLSRSRASTPSGSSSRSRSPDRFWERAREAFDLRLEGHSPADIAAILAITPSEVNQLLTQLYGFEAGFLSDQERKTALATEVARLDKLQTAVWPSAMMGDPKSVDSAVRIIQARAKITGLEQADPVVQKNLVLVMGDKEEDYIAALKAAGATPGET